MAPNQANKSRTAKAPRLHVDQVLSAEATIDLAVKQGHYLSNVLRLSAGDDVLVFNGRDGEWRTTIASVSRKSVVLQCREQIRGQTAPGGVHYLFAPLRAARLDYLVQKATEMGAARLTPVLTEYTNLRKLNKTRLAANIIEAAEQCGILSIPTLDDPMSLSDLLANWPAGNRLIFCDEAAALSSPLNVLDALDQATPAVLIGPEGGFSENERAHLLKCPFVTAISLGPRIMRADTAAVAALALIQAARGDWH